MHIYFHSSSHNNSNWLESKLISIPTSAVVCAWKLEGEKLLAFLRAQTCYTFMVAIKRRHGGRATDKNYNTLFIIRILMHTVSLAHSTAPSRLTRVTCKAELIRFLRYLHKICQLFGDSEAISHNFLAIAMSLNRNSHGLSQYIRNVSENHLKKKKEI